MEHSYALLALAVAVFLIAGTIKGTVGIGLPTVSVGLLSQSFDPRTAIALVLLPILVSNAWQVIRTGGFWKCLKDHWILNATLVTVLWMTTFFAAGVPERVLLTIIGCVIVAFTLISLFFKPPAVPDRYDKPFQAASGLAAGVLGGLTAIWAPPIVIYLLSRRIDKEDFVRATGVFIFLGSIPLCLGYWRAGLLTEPLAITSAAMIVPTLVGFTLGEAIRARLPTDNFRTVVLVMFLVMGLNLLRRALL